MAGLAIVRDQVQILNGVVIIVLLWLQHLFLCISASETVYFDRYGHCQRTSPFELRDEEYELKPVGGGFAHETLVCDITFKAPSEYGICLTFKEFFFEDCNVKLKIYSTSYGSGSAWRTLDCSDSRPNQMCTTSRFVTVQVAKEKLNGNKGYSFEIHVEKSNSVTEEGVLFASIGVFVGVILGVVLLITVLALSVLYCCCKKRKNKKKKNAQSAEAAAQENSNLVQPSAPPADLDDHPWAQHQLYPNLPPGSYAPPPEHPPPYVPPPPYQEENPIPAPVQSSAPDIEQYDYPVK